MSQQISIVVDDRTAATIEQLKQDFGLTSTAAVVRRALALARVATRNAAEDHTITLVDQENKQLKVLLRE